MFIIPLFTIYAPVCVIILINVNLKIEFLIQKWRVLVLLYDNMRPCMCRVIIKLYARPLLGTYTYTESNRDVIHSSITHFEKKLMIDCQKIDFFNFFVSYSITGLSYSEYSSNDNGPVLQVTEFREVAENAGRRGICVL